VVRRTVAAIATVLLATGTGINTAYFERVNATVRGAMAPLARRGRAIAQTEEGLQKRMSLVGCAYNFCWDHASLRRPAGSGEDRK
jgi:hypothetical protein